jgi:hypothetical protein
VSDAVSVCAIPGETGPSATTLQNGWGGTRTTPENTAKTADPQQGGAESGAVAPDAAAYSDLARIVAAWPTLPEPIRRAMLALIG